MFQERNKTQTFDTDGLNIAVVSDKSVDKRRRRSEKRKLWERGGCSGDEKKASWSCKRTASGSREFQQNSSSSEDSHESDEGTQQDKGNSVGAEGSGKSASLIEWSRFEESAAKLTVGVEGGGSDEDKQSIASDDRKLRDADDIRDNVLPCNGAKVNEGESGNKTGIESSEVKRNVRVTASEMVKKVLTGPSIADKLQEKLLRLERSSEEYKDSEETVTEAISESMSEEHKASSEVEKKTGEGSEISEDSESLSIRTKESDAVKNLNIEISGRTIKSKDGDSRRDSKDSDLSGSEKNGEQESQRGRSESPVVNKTPLKAEPKCYGKQYSPKVVLYNLVLPPGKILQGKVRSVTKELADQKPPAAEQEHPLLPAEPKQAPEISPEEQCTHKITTAHDSGKASCLESLLTNRSEAYVNHKTDTSHGSEFSDQKFDVTREENSINPESLSCSFPSSHKPNVVETDNLKMVENDGPADVKTKVAVSDNSSESGDSDIVMDSSKRTPEHGYSRCSIDDSLLENDHKMLESSNIEATKPSEQIKAVIERDVEQYDDQSSRSASAPVQEKGIVLESVQEKGFVLEPVREKVIVLETDQEEVSVSEPDQENFSKSEAIQENVTVSESVQETVKESEVVQSPTEEPESGAVMDTEAVNKDITANESLPDDKDAVHGSQSKTVVICSSASNPVNKDLDPLEKRSEREHLTEEANTNDISETNNMEQSTDKVSNPVTKEATCTDENEDERVHSFEGSNSCKDNSEVSVKLSIPQTAVLKVYPAKTCKALDKKIKDVKTSELSRTEALLGSGVTITPTTAVTTPAEMEAGANKTSTTTVEEMNCSGIVDKKIKEEPLDPDELVAESLSSGSTSTLSSNQNSAKSSPELKGHYSQAEKKEADGDKCNKGKVIFNKKLTLALLEDKERLSSNDSPSSVSEKDGIFPSLFLDPSITITVINDKQSENVDVPVSGKSKVSGSDINVNELRASVNLSKDISLTVVGAGYGGRTGSTKEISSGPMTPLDMECDHESDHDGLHNSSVNPASALIPLTVQNTTMGQSNTTKQKKQRPSGGSGSLQARSRARKSFPNRPIFPNVKVKSHPELVNGVGTFSNKSSLLRRNSAGTNSNSSDSRRGSYGTSPQEMLVSAQQSGGEAGAENFSGRDNNSSNNSGSAMVVLPPMLGNPATSTTNHIQALRTVNGNIGAPSHIVNGVPDMMPSRIIQVPHNQTHPVGNGTRISPTGQGPGAAAGPSRMPPQLQPRPPGPLLSQHPPSVPSEAGPVSADLIRHAHKVLHCWYAYHCINSHDRSLK